jgi:adenylate cyclase
LQDEVTLKIMAAMQIKLTAGEQVRLWEGQTKSIRAFDKLARGMECFNRLNEKDNKLARQLFKEAISLDKASAMSHALLGFTHIIDLLFRWSESPLQSLEKAEKNAEKALDLNDSLDFTHLLLAWNYLFKRQHDKAIEEAERAIELNPNGAEAHAQLAFIHILSDNTTLAIKLLNRALRLNPIPPYYYYDFLAFAYRNSGDYEGAIKLAKKSLRGNPDQLTGYLTLAASYSLLNRTEKAHKAVEDVLRINSDFSLEYYAKTLPYKRQATADKFVEAFRKAGLPE